LSNLELDRKTLSELAIRDSQGFSAIVDQVKLALAAQPKVQPVA
jgi:ribosomal protein L20